MRTFIFGDVHGCTVEFDALISRLALQDSDRLIFAGDLVDKGPDSAGVVRRVRELSAHKRVEVAMGNHEENHIRWMAKTPEKKTEMKRHAEFVEIHKNMTEADKEFVRSTVLYVQFPGGLVTHAGIPEWMRSLPEPLPFEKMKGKVKDLAKSMCRLRYVDDKGNFVGLYDTKPEHTFWADRYGGQYGIVYFGHQPFMQDAPKEFPNAFGIDLGCVFGGHLCAIELGSDGRPANVHLEKAREQYAPLYGEE